MSFSVTGYENPEYLREVADFVNERMGLLNQMQADMPPLKNAILTALNLADELMRTRSELAELQKDGSEFSQSVTERARKLNDLCGQS
jgi:cell division protein ZapA (FtsZ GTPase activity inhibitor)